MFHEFNNVHQCVTETGEEDHVNYLGTVDRLAEHSRVIWGQEACGRTQAVSEQEWCEEDL